MAAGSMTPPILSSEDEDDGGPGGQTVMVEMEVTTEDVVVQMTKAWQDEKLAPELLEPLEDEVEILRDELAVMEARLRKLHPTDMRLSIHRMEVKRLRYILTAYLRTRLLKIQEYAWYYVNEIQHQGRSRYPQMMKSEMLFLKEYVDNLDGFLQDVVLSHMPEKLQTFDERTRPLLRKAPNLHRFVFVRSNIDTELHFKDANNEKESVQFTVGSQHFMPYKPLQPYIKSGAVTLL